jgi:hypothetical protein
MTVWDAMRTGEESVRKPCAPAASPAAWLEIPVLPWSIGSRPGNVIINAIMLGLTPAEARYRYDAVIDFSELRGFEDLKLKNYSSGMYVRFCANLSATFRASPFGRSRSVQRGRCPFRRGTVMRGTHVIRSVG